MPYAERCVSHKVMVKTECVCTGECCFKCRKDGNKFNLGPQFYQIPLDTSSKGLNIKGRTGLAVAKPRICGKSVCVYSVQASVGSSVIRTVRSLGRWQSCASTLNWSMVTTGLSAAQSVARSGSEPVNWDFTCNTMDAVYTTKEETLLLSLAIFMQPHMLRSTKTYCSSHPHWPIP